MTRDNNNNNKIIIIIIIIIIIEKSKKGKFNLAQAPQSQTGATGIILLFL